MNKDDMAARGIASQALVEIEALNDDGVERRDPRLRGAALRHPARIDRRLLSGDEPLLALAHHDVKSGRRRRNRSR